MPSWYDEKKHPYARLIKGYEYEKAKSVKRFKAGKSRDWRAERELAFCLTDIYNDLMYESGKELIKVINSVNTSQIRDVLEFYKQPLCDGNHIFEHNECLCNSLDISKAVCVRYSQSGDFNLSQCFHDENNMNYAYFHGVGVDLGNINNISYMADHAPMDVLRTTMYGMAYEDLTYCALLVIIGICWDNHQTILFKKEDISFTNTTTRLYNTWSVKTLDEAAEVLKDANDKTQDVFKRFLLILTFRTDTVARAIHIMKVHQWAPTTHKYFNPNMRRMLRFLVMCWATRKNTVLGMLPFEIMQRIFSHISTDTHYEVDNMIKYVAAEK